MIGVHHDNTFKEIRFCVRGGNTYGRGCGQRSPDVSSDRSDVAEVVRSNEFRNGIVSQIAVSLEVTCIPRKHRYSSTI